MPSPIAHSSLLLLAWPAAARLPGFPRARWARGLLGLSIVGALLAPDGDILLDPLLGDAPFTRHGGQVHSLPLALLFGLCFALWCRLFTRISWPWLWLLGAAAWCSHVLMDAATYGRGVMLFWPLSADRFRFPSPIFVGLRHSDWHRWDYHLITLLNESAFVGIVLVAAYLLARLRTRHAAPPAPAHPEGSP